METQNKVTELEIAEQALKKYESGDYKILGVVKENEPELFAHVLAAKIAAAKLKIEMLSARQK